MPTKENRAELSLSGGDLLPHAKSIERFLRLLTWQMFFLLALLLYIVMRPQPGRYQFTVVGEDAGVFDTAYGRAHLVKLQKQIQKPGETQPSSGVPATETVPMNNQNPEAK
ncbi:MAG: hypothetical protein FJ147_10710 [Deltaproteobacteria bacterium]|nr:hypothetical protein [Deltaproteobacteria bacterium]